MVTPTHVLDTDLFSLFVAAAEPVTSRVLAAPPGSVCIAVVTVEEALGGWYTLLRRATQPAALAFAYERLALTATACGKLPIFTLTVPGIARSEALVRQKLGVTKNDLRIAAIALELGAAVVTRNARDFGRVPGLAVADWSAP